MSLANFYTKAALAASQILRGFDEVAFRERLENCLVCISFDDGVVDSVEAKTTLELTVNLLSRLYPKLVLKPKSENTKTLAEGLIALAKSINPSIEFGSDSDQPTFCISVGASSPDISCPIIYVGSDGWILKVSSKNPVGSGATENPFGAGAAACFAAANAFRFLFSEQLGGVNMDSHFQMSLVDWDPSNSTPPNPIIKEINIGEAYLVGVGAIGNAVIWSLARVGGIQGVLHLIDNEVIDLSNLQRYVLTDQTHLNIEKVLLGVQSLTKSQLKVDPHQQSWGEYLTARKNWNLERVMVAVDSADVRRNIQASLPHWIVNAWTQPGDLGISRHSFLGDQACLMCLYFPEGTAKSEDLLVAEAIGMPDNYMEIRNMLYLQMPLSHDFLTRIAAAKNISLDSLLHFEGRPLRSLYVEGICGGALLGLNRESNSHRMEVPMNFQSALAGIMLSAELVASVAHVNIPPPVTTKIDLLKPLGSYLSLPAPKHSSGRCICQDTDYISAYRAKYNGNT
jgi:hypothetical protein